MMLASLKDFVVWFLDNKPSGGTWDVPGTDFAVLGSLVLAFTKKRERRLCL